jgi:hypothetical protein
MKENMESRLVAIENRNKKVELDKKWETSWTRRLSIVVLTYAVVFTYLTIIGNNNPAINACVPPAGFFLSTLVLKRVRTIWQTKI